MSFMALNLLHHSEHVIFFFGLNDFKPKVNLLSDVFIPCQETLKCDAQEAARGL